MQHKQQKIINVEGFPFLILEIWTKGKINHIKGIYKNELAACSEFPILNELILKRVYLELERDLIDWGYIKVL